MPGQKVPDSDRLAALDVYDILDTPAEAGFDDIVLLACQICDVPVALVSLVGAERQWFKARIGFEPCETPLDQSVCAHAIEQGSMLIIPDLALDERTRRNTLVTEDPHIRFYAGALLETPEGQALGTLCVIDGKPRPQGLTDAQKSGLQALAGQVMAQLQLRRVARLEADARRHVEQTSTRYKAVFESAVDYAIIVMDTEGLIVDWNEGARRILGWTAEEICGQDLSRFFTPEDRAAGLPARELEAARIKGRSIDERWHLRKNGDGFWANGEMMPMMAPGGALLGYVKILRDRTEQRLADERLKRSERRWRELFENMREGFFLGELIRDEAGKPCDCKFIEINPAFSEQSGLPVTSVGRTISSFAVNVRQALIDRFARTVDAGEPQTFEIHVPELARWFEVRSKQDAGERFSCLFFDITERKSAEAQKHLLMEELSHRVKNSFAVVQAIASQTLRHTDPETALAFQSRIMALSQAHDVLLQTSWASATVHSLMQSVLGLQAEASRFDIDGPALTIGSKAALSLSMLMHEMATNALKHGALSVETGKVVLRWAVEDDVFELDWRETGGPPAQSPGRRGFGSRLIGLGICGTRGTELSYGQDGLVAKFTAAISIMNEIET